MTKPPQIIVADDDRSVRMVIVHALSKQGYQVMAASTIASMWDLLQAGTAELLVTDIGFPDGDALELLPRIQDKYPDMTIIMMSARANLLTAIKTQQNEVFDYLPKPFELKALLATVERALTVGGRPEIQSQIAVTPSSISPSLMGKSPAMQLTFKMMTRYVAQNSAVLIQAEQGTNKLDIAHTMLEMSGLGSLALVDVDLSKIDPDTQFETLFSAKGILDRASEKALFINGIEFLIPDAQTSLVQMLAFTNGQLFMPPKRLFIGTATNLKLMVEQGLFREDLYEMLSVSSLRIPALRDRKQDINTLAQHFCEAENAYKSTSKLLSPDCFSILQNHHWPFNVKELQEIIQKSHEITKGDVISAETIDGEIRNAQMINLHQPNRQLSGDVQYHLDKYFNSLGGDMPAPDLYQRILHEIERPLLTSTLRFTKGNQIKAAEILGLNRNTLRKKIRELKLSSKRADYRHQDGKFG